jgi:hypothetical protein
MSEMLFRQENIVKIKIKHKTKNELKWITKKIDHY